MGNETTTPEFVQAWADAITVHEGWHPGSRSFRNSNPGNLEVHGDLGVDAAGYGRFSSYALGRAALIADLNAKVRKYALWTVHAVMARYAPPSENNTFAYAAAVARALSVETNTVLGSIAASWAARGLRWTPHKFEGQKEERA